MSVKVRRNVTVRAEGHQAVKQAIEALAAEVENSDGRAIRLTVETTPSRWSGWTKVVAKLASVRETY